MWEGEERRADVFSQEDKRHIEERMLRAEWTIGLHAEEITQLKSTTNEISNGLEKIEITLDRIKFVAYGAIGFYVADSIGVIPVLKSMVGL